MQAILSFPHQPPLACNEPGICCCTCISYFSDLQSTSHKLRGSFNIYF
uniref:Uncharacterized protein n=1 Tax=Arundo donax TaxID=35708 RepID=A0A0A8Z0K0_ARUDO